MSKDWKRYKAELEQLYITEKKPLKEVQQLLRDRHGFIASTRAYRMRLDEWGLRKYTTGKDVQTVNIRRHSRSLTPEQKSDATTAKINPINEVCEQNREDNYVRFPGGVFVPRTPIKVADLWRMIPPFCEYTFEILLVKWQQDGEYMEIMRSLLKRVEYRYYVWIRPTVQFSGEWLIKLIQRKTSDSEQVELMKSFFHPYQIPKILNYESIPSKNPVGCLAAVYMEDSWEGAKLQLFKSDVSATFGQKAVNCALVVIAEKQLQMNKACLQGQCSGRGKPEAYQEYLKILEDFESAEIDVDQSWYKYALQVQNEGAFVAQERIQRFANEKSLKYRQLIASYTGVAEKDVDVQLDGLLKAENEKRSCVKESKNNVPPSPSCFIGHTSTQFVCDKDTRDSNISIAQQVLGNLLAKYLSSGKIDEKTVESTLSVIGCHDRVYNQNIFNIIPRAVKTQNQIPFAKSLLSVCLNYKPEYPFWPLFLGEYFTFPLLESLYKVQTWDRFQAQLPELEKCISRLAVPWPSKTIRLFSDCMVLLVGERLLCDLKTTLGDQRFSNMSESVHGVYRKEYVSILRTFFDRRLVVDKRWLVFSFQLMESLSVMRERRA